MSHCLDVRKNIHPRRPPDKHLAPFQARILCRQSARPGLPPLSLLLRGYLTSFPTSIATFEVYPWQRPFSPQAGLPAYVPIVCARDSIGAYFLCSRRLNQGRVPRSLRYASPPLPHSPLEFPNRLPILGLSTPFFVTFNDQMERQLIIVVYMYSHLHVKIQYKN